MIRKSGSGNLKVAKVYGDFLGFTYISLETGICFSGEFCFHIFFIYYSTPLPWMIYNNAVLHGDHIIAGIEKQGRLPAFFEPAKEV
ncbi:hypothetical protein J0K78_02905 [Halobacillus sp. GSS1]|uniref:hypothetical protein n=1 Tax=Halobacillus sp. GSS1 TaxID=2815919 RepID=UPI001A8C009B|nr:hypothetical protein [Halobacillus sp. GSS1]MBN9653201.1 hypothetical protein [Halobacillus sp. GSS1]